MQSNRAQNPTVNGKQSQYKKTEPRMRLFPSSKLSKIHKETNISIMSYVKVESKQGWKWQFSRLDLPVFVQKCFQLTLDGHFYVSSTYEIHFIQFNSKLCLKSDFYTIIWCFLSKIANWSIFCTTIFAYNSRLNWKVKYIWSL